VQPILLDPVGHRSVGRASKVSGRARPPGTCPVGAKCARSNRNPLQGRKPRLVRRANRFGEGETGISHQGRPLGFGLLLRDPGVAGWEVVWFSGEIGSEIGS
jgi:hypothetical protein